MARPGAGSDARTARQLWYLGEMFELARQPSPRCQLDAAEGYRLRRVHVFQIVSGLLWPVQAAAIAWAVSDWAAGATGATWSAALLFLGAGVLRAVLTGHAERNAFRVADKVVHDERERLLDREARLLRPDLSSAEVAALVTEKIPALAPYFSRYRPAMMRVRVLPLAYLALVAAFSWIAALVLVVAGPLIPVFMALVGMAARDASARQMAEIGDMNRLLVDRIAVMPDARLLDGEARSRRAFAAAAERLRARTMAVLRIAFLSSTVLELFAALGIAMVAVYVGFSLLGEITVGAWATPLTLFEGLFILLLAPEFFQPLRDLAAAWHDKAAADSVRDELSGLEDTRPPAILGQGRRVAPLAGAPSITLEGVTVRRGARVIALPDLHAAPGDSIALQGPSGSGKSTLLDTIAGLVEPETGAVSVAGQPLTGETADAWRARCALVPQAVHLPDVTLREFLDPHGDGADPAPALGKARALDVVAALPDGLETRLGETGAGVSGGEMRRLMLARAFHKGTDVIMVDEPTADLDDHTAALILDTLREAAAEGRTVIAATHDPALIAAMARTVTMGGIE